MRNFANSMMNKESLRRSGTHPRLRFVPCGLLPRLARSNRPGFVCGSRLLLSAAICLLLLGASPSAWAQVTFDGVVSILSTSSLALNQPGGTAIDTAGNVYIADQGNSRIVKVNPQGVASILAISGLSPDLSAPRALAVDSAGNLYIADSGNLRIVKVSSSGSGSVVSLGGLTLAGPTGVAVDASGNIFIADTGNNRIVEVPAGGTASVLSITGLGGTPLNSPAGVAVDTSGNLYIADTSNNRIATVAAGGTVGAVLSISGLGTGLAGPQDVAVDGLGNVYIADAGNLRIVKVTPAGAGSVLGTGSVTLAAQTGVAVDIYGTVYVTDTLNDRIVKVAGSAVGSGHLQLGTAAGITQTLPFTVSSAATIGAVKAFTLGTEFLDFTVASGSTCINGTTSTTCNVNIQFLPTAPGLRRGAVVLYDDATPQNPLLTVQLYGFADAPVAALAPNTGTVINTGGVTTANPFQLALDGAGNMYVGNYSGQNVTRIAAGGGSASVVSLGTPAGTAVQNITGVALDGAGNLFIGDHENSRILVVTPGGVVSVLNISGLSQSLGFPVALAFDGAGNLYIADFTYSRIIKVSSLAVAGSTSSGLGKVIGTGSYTFPGSTLTGVAVDLKGTVYIAARTDNNSSIVEVTAVGVASLLATTGVTLSNPQGVGVDEMGNVYVVDSGHSRIVEITTAGVVSILSISGLTSPSTLGTLLFGVTVDPSGSLYISDWTNNRIVFVNVTGASLTFASTRQGLTSADSPKTATVTNVGNQALVFSTNPTYTADFSNNSSDTNPCTSSTSLAAGTVCDVSVNFTPQSVGSLSAGITVTNNALNVATSTQQVSASGTGLTPGDTTSTTVAVSPTSLTNGQTATITATVSDTTSGHTSTIPTGPVTFTDTVGSTLTNLNGGNSVNLSAGRAILTGVLLSGIGTHTINAVYAGVSGSYITSMGSTTVGLSKASVTVAGPATQPVVVTVGQAGSAAVTVTGPYTTIAVPTGSLNYNILNASNASVASGTLTLTAGSTSSTASVPIPNTLTSGSYTVSVTYSGDGSYLASSTATTIQLQINQITPVLQWSQPSPITYGTSLTAILNPSALNGSSSVAGTFAYTATPAGGSASPVTSATVLGAGTYTLNVTFTPTDTTTYTTMSGAVSLTVNQTAPTVALVSSLNPSLLASAVTFTATVSSMAGTPSGSVNFHDGTTLLGSGTLTAGVATYTTSSLPVGAHSITAIYGGDANFVTVTSSAVAQTVEDFTLNVSTTGGASVTAAPGGTATYTFQVAPSGGATFPAAVTFSLSGLPAGATATITPQTILAGAGSTTVTMVIQLANTVLAQNSANPLGRGLALAMMGGLVLLLPFGRKMRRSAGRAGRLAGLMLLLMAATCGTLGLTTCGGGGGSGYFGQQVRSYLVSITGTSGALSHTTTVNLTVK